MRYRRVATQVTSDLNDMYSHLFCSCLLVGQTKGFTHHFLPAVLFPLHLQAPFLDVLGTLEDPSLPLTLEDREEWGDPVENPEHRLAISSYCPLSNITAQVGPKAAAARNRRRV